MRRNSPSSSLPQIVSGVLREFLSSSILSVRPGAVGTGMAKGQTGPLKTRKPATMITTEGHRLYRRMWRWVVGSLGWLRSRRCRVKDPEKLYGRSLIRPDLVDHRAGVWSSPAQGACSTFGSRLLCRHEAANTHDTASAKDLMVILELDGAGEVLRSQGADCFLIYVVCSTRLFPEATQLEPQRGRNLFIHGHLPSNMMPSSAVLKANGRLPCQAEHRTHPER